MRLIRAPRVSVAAFAMGPCRASKLDHAVDGHPHPCAFPPINPQVSSNATAKIDWNLRPSVGVIFQAATRGEEYERSFAAAVSTSSFR
jgi:hypothetical protein